MSDRGRVLRHLDAAIRVVDERLEVLAVVEGVRVARGEPVTRERDEAQRLNARRVRLIARRRHHESCEPRTPHAQDFPETPAPFFAYRGADPTADTALANLSRKTDR